MHGLLFIRHNNLGQYIFYVGKIDSTAPTIRSVSVSGRTASITADDKNETLGEGSGVTQYRFLGSGDSAITWQSSNVLNLPAGGRYYLFVKDAVGNISAKWKINVE